MKRHPALVCLFLIFLPLLTVQAGRNWLHTEGGLIKDSWGHPVALRGVVMFACLQNEQAKFTQAAAMGANVVRLAIWKNAIEGNPTGPCVGQNGLAALDQAIGYAKNAGLMVILDEHIWAPNVNDAPAAFFTDPAVQEQWLAMWRLLINRYKNDQTVIGIDLMNEPWAIPGKPSNAKKLWETIAKNAEAELHPLNPNLLIFVSGWGPVTQPMWNDMAFLQKPNVVIKDHVYGIKTVAQLNTRYGLYRNALVPVWLGEIGFSNTTGMESQLDNFDALGLHYTIFVYGVDSWNLAWDIVEADYSLNALGIVYRDHLSGWVGPNN